MKLFRVVLNVFLLGLIPGYTEHSISWLFEQSARFTTGVECRRSKNKKRHSLLLSVFIIIELRNGLVSNPEKHFTSKYLRF
jgi:hypothetical protein